MEMTKVLQFKYATCNVRELGEKEEEWQNFKWKWY
jgi:hypothetical protein